MPKRKSNISGSELFIVDNSDDDWKVVRYLKDWCELSKAIDVATGYFEIGSLLALSGEWHKVDKIRILMGDEVSKRTKRAFIDGLEEISSRLDQSIETEKISNPFLDGVPAIVEAIRSGQIECRVYRKDKFHAKAYITHGRKEVIGSTALVGSSNFTYPGLTDNIELNVQITGSPVAVLQEWYEEHWEQAEDVSPEILQVVERHTIHYKPFDVYARSLQQYFHAHEETASEWDKNSSEIYPILARYQRDGYLDLLKKANKWGGAFLCDGVGLGKTFIGLMLIERFVLHENKNVALFVPKSAKEPVWERELRKRLPDVLDGFGRLKVFSHTDLLRDKMQGTLEQVRKQADVIIIDEAHHFRNKGTKGDGEDERKSRYWRLYDIAENKQIFHLTATPINNSLKDFQHMVELFSREPNDYFKNIGIHSLLGHIKQLEKIIEGDLYGGNSIGEINMSDAADALAIDDLFKELVVQRSRSYVKESMKREGDDEVLFPEPRKPLVAEYSVKQTYGKLLDMISEAFHRVHPLFYLSIYNPYEFYIGTEETGELAAEKNRQKQVVALIRSGFLKRFESSAKAFEQSSWNLLWKMLAWLEVHAETDDEKTKVEHWKRRNKTLIEYTSEPDLLDDKEDDFISPELLSAVKTLERKDFDVGKIIDQTIEDLNQLVVFLRELAKFQPKQDKKLGKLINLLQKDTVLSKHKVIIFTQFTDTARYIYAQIKEAGIEGIAQIDSGTKGNRSELIKRFSPFYNDSSSSELRDEGLEEIRVLVSTDVLSEGLNLQDATRLINYDVHWNPVRLMQRIGRVDRRMNAEIEKRIIAENPDQKKIRGTTGYWNFLPPGEIEVLLGLFNKVSHKTLRISKTLGIEGKRLLTEDDDFADLKNFEDQYEGKQTPDEEMHLIFQDMLRNNADLEEKLNGFPNGIFSGKEHINSGRQAAFFCYARPAHDVDESERKGRDIWTTAAGDVKWYLYDVENDKIIEDAPSILSFIQCAPDTERKTNMEETSLIEIKSNIEKHIKQTYLRKVQAPIGVEPTLKAWMELS
jgi:superfamily II DNA/RNA helicase